MKTALRWSAKLGVAKQALVFALCSLPAAAQPQTAPAPPAAEPGQPVIRTTVQEVLLDLIVRDRKGRLVRDLKPEEIEVFDQNSRQKLTGFRLITGTEAAGLGSRLPSAEGPKEFDPMRQVRLVSLVFEGLSAEARRLARQAALDFVQNELEQNLYIAVYMVDKQLFAIQPYTNRLEPLRKAIDQATSGRYREYAAQSAAIKAELQKARGQSSAGPAGGGITSPGAGQAAGIAAAEGRMSDLLISILEFSDRLTRTQESGASIFSLLALIKEQAPLPGRKTVLYFSEGLQIPDTMVEYFRGLTGEANRAGVSLYAVDARGLTLETQNAPMIAIGETGGAQNMEIFDTARENIHGNVQQTLNALAASTGGKLIANTNDLRVPLQRIREEVLTYYELAYVPPIQEYDAGFRKVAVKLSRPGVIVQTRSGYFALPPTQDSVLAYEMPLLSLLNAASLPKTFPYWAGARRFWKDSGKLLYGLVVQVPMEGVTFVEEKEANRHRAHISFIVLLRNQQGEVVQRFSRDLGFYAPAGKLEAYRKHHFTGTFHLNLDPGRYMLDSVVMDREAQQASARRVAVVVAPPAGLGISNLTFVRRLEPQAAQLDPSDPFQFEGKRIIPMLDNTIRPGADAGLSFYFVVSPAAEPAEKPTAILELSRDGVALARVDLALPAPDARGLIPYLASFPVAKIDPGQYDLRVMAQQGQLSAIDVATFVVENPAAAAP